MNVSELRDYIFEKKHLQYRKKLPENLAEKYSAASLAPRERMVRRFEYLCANENPIILDGEKIVFTRTVENIPDILTEEEWAEIRKSHFVHERGYLSNYSPDYATVIRNGLLSLCGKDAGLDREIAALLDLVARYGEKARELGRDDICAALSRVPAYGARTFREALQSFRILHFALWLEGNFHVTCGRFDQYMYPYLRADLDAGLLDEDEAFALLREFFLSFNKDSDTYVGVQQGDNGQSMVLGGIDKDGNEVFNLLSKLCLRASFENKMIDPKINLRVSSKTPLEIFELGSELTRAGLGFPQYSNDDVVIPALEKLGYDTADARDYAVAACWEFIIPGRGFDIANIGALSFPRAIDRVLHADKIAFPDYASLEGAVKEQIGRECDEICGNIHDLFYIESPLLLSLLTPKYKNFGIHGTGLSTAADSLAAIRKFVFDEKRLTLEELVAAMDEDFRNSPALLHALRVDAPKMGNDDDLADEISVTLLDAFASALKGRRNCLGGAYRAGTGSAMFYLRHAEEIGASADGRRKGEPFGANFSPSLFAKVKGPMSVIRSFTKQHFSDAINGGPLTMEFSSSVFDEGCDGVRKTAMLVRAFIQNGGHQLQLNSVCADELRDAQEHPEAHRGLIVRVWGWSAYFVELDRAYQDHVIARSEFRI